MTAFAIITFLSVKIIPISNGTTKGAITAIIGVLGIMIISLITTVGLSLLINKYRVNETK